MSMRTPVLSFQKPAKRKVVGKQNGFDGVFDTLLRLKLKTRIWGVFSVLSKLEI